MCLCEKKKHNTHTRCFVERKTPEKNIRIKRRRGEFENKKRQMKDWGVCTEKFRVINFTSFNQTAKIR